MTRKPITENTVQPTAHIKMQTIPANELVWSQINKYLHLLRALTLTPSPLRLCTPGMEVILPVAATSTPQGTGAPQATSADHPTRPTTSTEEAIVQDEYAALHREAVTVAERVLPFVDTYPWAQFIASDIYFHVLRAHSIAEDAIDDAELLSVWNNVLPHTRIHLEACEARLTLPLADAVRTSEQAHQDSLHRTEAWLEAARNQANSLESSLNDTAGQAQ